MDDDCIYVECTSGGYKENYLLSAEYKTNTERKTMVVLLDLIIYLTHTQTSQQKKTDIITFHSDIIMNKQ